MVVGSGLEFHPGGGSSCGKGQCRRDRMTGYLYGPACPLFRAIAWSRYVEVIVFSLQHGIFSRLCFVSTPPFCEPTIPSIASDYSANQKRRSVVNAARLSVECREFNQSRRVVSRMVKANT